MSRDIAHLWRRAGFGATPEDLRRSIAQGYERTVHELVHWDAAPELDMPPPFSTTFPPGTQLTLLQIARIIQWWLQRMVASRRPLQEKLTLFWHGHFTTSADPVIFPALLLGQNETLRALAGGRFSDLLNAVAKDPAMLIYLDGMRNTKAHPNENFAREVMELYTLGVGHYTERDVREAARAFTGWTVTVPGGRFHFDAEQHDDGPKRLLGQTGQLDGDDVVRILAAHPRTGEYVGGRLFRFFVDRDSTDAERAEIAEVFRRHNGTIRPVVQHILLSDAFRASASQRVSVKSPVEYLVSALRALRGEVAEFDLLKHAFKMGQLPFLPPSVKGWPDGRGWINTSTLLDRLEFAHAVAEGLGRPIGLHDKLQGACGTSAARRILGLLGVVDPSEKTVAVLARAWDAPPARRTGRLLEIALSSPEFQLR